MCEPLQIRMHKLYYQFLLPSLSCFCGRTYGGKESLREHIRKNHPEFVLPSRRGKRSVKKIHHMIPKKEVNIRYHKIVSIELWILQRSEQ